MIKLTYKHPNFEARSYGLFYFGKDKHYWDWGIGLWVEWFKEYKYPVVLALLGKRAIKIWSSDVPTPRHLDKEKQREAEDNWCELMGLEKNDFNRSLAPVIAGEWEKNNIETNG